MYQKSMVGMCNHALLLEKDKQCCHTTKAIQISSRHDLLFDQLSLACYFKIDIVTASSSIVLKFKKVEEAYHKSQTMRLKLTGL